MISEVTVVVCRKPYDPVKVCASPHGEDIERHFRLKVDADGNNVYEFVEEIKISEFVESFRNGCSLKSILDRCALMPLNSKVSYLQQTEDGISADLSNMPSDGTEARILLEKLRNTIPGLDEAIKSGSDLNKFITEHFAQKSSKTFDVNSVQNHESEVTSNG